MCSLPMDHYIINMTLYGALHCREGVLACVTLRCVCVLATFLKLTKAPMQKRRKRFFSTSVMCEIFASSVTAAEAGQEVRRDEEFQLHYFLLALVNISCLLGERQWVEGGESAFKVNKKLLDGVLSL